MTDSDLELAARLAAESARFRAEQEADEMASAVAHAHVLAADTPPVGAAFPDDPPLDESEAERVRRENQIEKSEPEPSR